MSETDFPEDLPDIDDPFGKRLRLEKERDDALHERIEQKLATMTTALEKRVTVTPKGVPIIIDGTHSVPDEGGADDEEPNPKDLVGCRKPSSHLFPASAVIFASMAMKDGANKYGAYNWRTKKITASEYVSAAKRHIDSWFDGEELSRDSDVHHLGAAIASLGILIDAMTCDCLKDDRPPPGKASDLIEELTIPKEPETP